MRTAAYSPENPIFMPSCLSRALPEDRIRCPEPSRPRSHLKFPERSLRSSGTLSEPCAADIYSAIAGPHEKNAAASRGYDDVPREKGIS